MNRFAKFSWAVLGWNMLVILWGAIVRATGSGAGCGSHWPSCNGVILPTPERIQTVIEFTHRLMSGGAMILILILLIWGLRSYPKGSHQRIGFIGAAIFINVEALLGASLVLWLRSRHGVHEGAAVVFTNPFELGRALQFALLFAVVPVIGLAFLMFLPAIGFALFGKALVMRVTGQVAEGASSLAATISPDLATGAAYMTGHKEDEKAAGKVTPEIEKLEKEISEKRS